MADTVAMRRNPDQFPAPHTADVHPDEVNNYAAGGWQVAAAGDKPLEERTIAELRAHAEDHGYDLGDAKKKDDILAAISLGAEEAAKAVD